MVEQVEQHRLSPVQVLEDGDERLLGRDRLELLANLPEQVLRRGGPTLGDAPSVGADLAELHQHPSGPERDPVAVVEAAPRSPPSRPARPRRGTRRRGATCLRPQAPSSVKRSQPAPPRPARTPSQEVELALPRDERRVEPAGDRRRRPTVTSRYATTGSAFPFQLERLDRLDRDRGADEVVRRGADEDLPGSAACSRRAATPTASPVASVCPAPTTTSPVLTPVRKESSTPSSAATAGSRSRISAAARPPAGHRPRAPAGCRRRPSRRRRRTSPRCHRDA